MHLPGACRSIFALQVATLTPIWCRLRYDGKEFTELTEREIMWRRANQIAANPEGFRQRNVSTM
jgi:hypothetical protein